MKQIATWFPYHLNNEVMFPVAFSSYLCLSLYQRTSSSSFNNNLTETREEAAESSLDAPKVTVVTLTAHYLDNTLVYTHTLNKLTYKALH